jgi:hypothetical protein
MQLRAESYSSITYTVHTLCMHAWISCWLLEALAKYLEVISTYMLFLIFFYSAHICFLGESLITSSPWTDTTHDVSLFLKFTANIMIMLCLFLK